MGIVSGSPKGRKSADQTSGVRRCAWIDPPKVDRSKIISQQIVLRGTTVAVEFNLAGRYATLEKWAHFSRAKFRKSLYNPVCRPRLAITMSPGLFTPRLREHGGEFEYIAEVSDWCSINFLNEPSKKIEALARLSAG
jgi:hypothetical protein